MWAVSVLGNNFQSVNSILVSDDVIQNLWPILLDPTRDRVSQSLVVTRIVDTHHGSSYATEEESPFAGAFPLLVDAIGV